MSSTRLICNSGKTLKAFFNIPQKSASIICGVIGKIYIFYLNFQDDFLFNGRLHYENDRNMTCRSSDISSPFYGKRWYPGYNEMAANGTWQQQQINNMKYLIPRPKYLKHATILLIVFIINEVISIKSDFIRDFSCKCTKRRTKYRILWSINVFLSCNIIFIYCFSIQICFIKIFLLRVQVIYQFLKIKVLHSFKKYFKFSLIT